jgi:hypothetical protein
VVLQGKVTTDPQTNGSGIVLLPCHVVVANGACEVRAVGDVHMNYHFSGQNGELGVTTRSTQGS